MIKILIVDDEEPIANLIRMNLTRQGYVCTCAYDGQQAADLLEKNQFDLVLLDIMLPKYDGYDLLAYIRPMGIPVIFLTASGDENSVVKGLDMGADDYITKPFRPRELVSRIRSVLRRSGAESVLLLGNGVTVDPDRGVVTKDGGEIKLSALEFRLLMAFLNHRGKLMTREKLLEDIWDIAGDFVNDNTLTVYIKRLRVKLGDDPQDPQIIKTVRGLGYRMD